MKTPIILPLIAVSALAQAQEFLSTPQIEAKIRPVVRAFRSSEREQRLAAMAEAARLSDLKSMNYLRPGCGTGRELQMRASSLFTEFAKQEPALLLRLVSSRDEDVRAAAVLVTGELAPDGALDELRRVLESDASVTLRAFAAGALGRSGDKKAVPFLITALKSTNEEVKQGAATGLRLLPDPRAVEPLVTALKVERDELARTIAIALGEQGDRRAVDPLIAALRREKEPHLASAACYALGRLRDPKALPALRRLAAEGPEGIREDAKYAITEIEGPTPPPLA